jgi:hypothetical protein
MPRGQSLADLKKKAAGKQRGQSLAQAKKKPPRGKRLTLRGNTGVQADIQRLQREATQNRKKGNQVAASKISQRIANIKKKFK